MLYSVLVLKFFFFGKKKKKNKHFVAFLLRSSNWYCTLNPGGTRQILNQDSSVTYQINPFTGQANTGGTRQILNQDSSVTYQINPFTGHRCYCPGNIHIAIVFIVSMSIAIRSFAIAASHINTMEFSGGILPSSCARWPGLFCLFLMYKILLTYCHHFHRVCIYSHPFFCHCCVTY